MSGPLVSVIIPTFNRARETAQAAASVLAQTVQDLELIVVDDGSADGAERALAPWRSRLVFERLPANGGPARARNVGIAKARGELLAFLDSDDLWVPRKLERQLPHFRDASIVWTFSEVDVEAGGRSVKNAYSASRALYPDRYWAGRTMAVCSTVVVRRTHAAALGGFDESFRTSCIEDLDFVLRLERRCGPAAARYDPEPLVIKRGGAAIAGSLRSSDDPQRLLDLACWRIKHARGVYG